MALSIAGSSAAGAQVWGQLQQQQAQRTADQAEARAQALAVKAREAQSEAQQAQEKARKTDVEHGQAEEDAGTAKRNLLSLKSLGEASDGLQKLRDQIAGASYSILDSSTTSATAGVTNALGQQTGTLVDVTA